MSTYLRRFAVATLTVLLLFSAALDWEYGYFQVLRWVVFLGAIYIAQGFKEAQAMDWSYLFIGIAILFNPIIPFYFQRETWLTIDIITAFVYIFAAGNIFDERS